MCINISVIVISAKNELIDSVTFDLWRLNPWPCHFRISQFSTARIMFEHFGIIRFWVMLRTNRQTNKQTEPNILRAPTDSAGIWVKALAQLAVLERSRDGIYHLKIILRWRKTTTVCDVVVPVCDMWRQSCDVNQVKHLTAYDEHTGLDKDLNL